jgi:DNA-binding IclR family transcriptional regulator
VDDRGYALDVRCIAAPVFAERERVVAAVGITGLASELCLDDGRLAEAVMAAAQQLSVPSASSALRRAAGAGGPER